MEKETKEYEYFEMLINELTKVKDDIDFIKQILIITRMHKINKQ